MSRVVLVTGGCGFIGANFVKMFLDSGLESDGDFKVVNVDALTYAANPSFLEETRKRSPNRYEFVKADIRDAQTVTQIFKDHKITDVIHFAAESHVDNSISNPDAFIQTNINGTFNLLEAARHHWMLAPFRAKPEATGHRFLHVSTDEVYGSLGATGAFSETTPYAPNSPYSASKAASDHLVRAYHHTFGLNTIITNCSNNYGPNQHDEKLIPTIIRNALAGRPIPIYGDGQNVRDWLFVEDHCRGIWAAFSKADPGETYNIGGNSEITNLEVCGTICDVLQDLVPHEKTYRDQITFVKDRPGHDRRYAIDASKIKAHLGWAPRENFKSGLQKTVRWYLKKYAT